MGTLHESLSASQLARIGAAEAATVELARELVRVVSGVDVGRARTSAATRRWNDEDFACSETTFEEGSGTVKLLVTVGERQREEMVSSTHVTSTVRAEATGLPNGARLAVAVWVLRLLGEAKSGGVSVEIDAAPDRVAAVEKRVKEWASGA